jgi:predicted permease
MSDIILIILTIIAPIILIAALGAGMDHHRVLDSRSLSRLIIYLFSPSLAFHSMANATLNGSEVVGLFSFAILVLLITTGLGWLVTVGFKMNKLAASAFVMSVTLTNIGNYGIPFCQFAFGQPGLERALVITVAYAMYAYSMGVVLASWGQASLWQATKNAFTVPTPYAAVLGLAVNYTGLPLPDLLTRVVGLLQGATVPMMLILLGIQIYRVKFAEAQWGIIFGASAMRLLGGPIIGVLIAGVLGLQGVTRQVAIMQSAMPTAVMATILATEFDSDPQLTSGAVMVTTTASIITLSLLLYLIW